uniref:Integral membrane protein n=1 Tax=Moniliophthora roreri TaxID=221103 RepID=A0A0W0FB98_MONRR
MSSQSELEEAVAPFLDRQYAVTLPLNTIIVNLLVYGIYVVIFGICVSIFRHSRKDPDNDRRNKIYVWSTYLLFSLATILTAELIWHYYDQVVFSYDAARSKDYEPLLEYLGKDDVKMARRGIVCSLRALICLTSDLTVIHRCYTIWDSRKIVALPLLFAALCSTCVAVAGGVLMALGKGDTFDDLNWDLYVKGNRMALGVEVINAIISFSVALLSAGRIWFISRQVRQLLGRKTSFMYRTVIAIMRVNQLIAQYHGAIAINLIIIHVSGPDFKKSAPIDFSTVVYQVSGIAPTLVIARARAGKSIESVNRTFSTLQFATHQDVENPRESMSHPQQVSISIRGSPRDRDQAASTGSNSGDLSVSEK